MTALMPLDIQTELKAAKTQLMRTCQHPQAERNVCQGHE
jgi:hypothetical protein